MKVESSTISEVDYDALTKSLKVVFKKGGVYTYKNVEESVFTEFVKAESAGSFFQKNVRSKYEFEKLKDNETKIQENV